MLIVGTIFISSVGAADLNNDTATIDDILEETDDTTEISVDKPDVNITSKEQIETYGNNANTLEVHVTDKDGNNVNNGSVTFVDVFGKNYTAEVKSGVALSNRVYIGETGTFDITCLYNGLDLYNNATSKIVLKVPVADTLCKNIVATRYGDTVYFTGAMFSNYTAYTGTLEEVSEGNVTIFVDGNELGTCDVDVNGNFVYIWKTTQNLIGQTINVTGKFTNNKNHYNPSNFTETFTFPAPKGTEISYNTTLIDKDNTLISGIVKDDTGNTVVGGEITINNAYSIPVDTNGKFSFYITNEKTGKANYTIDFMDWGSKADITINEPLMNGIKHTELVDQLIDLCRNGTPYIKFGNGNGKTVIVNAGTHGGELPAQIAAFKLIDLLANYGDEIDGTIYVIPVIFPEATANNVRIFNGTNLNVVAEDNGSISNNLVKFARSINASGLGDFHSTRHADSDVGITCVMGSEVPTYESYLLATYISNETGYIKTIYHEAGVPYAGAIEDYSNILGGPAITSEVCCNHRAVEYGAPEISFNMMRAFLRFYGFDVNEMINIPSTGNAGTLTFTSSYNYNSSSKSINLKVAPRFSDNSNVNMFYADGSSFKVRVYGNDANPVGANQVVTMTLNKVTYNVKTNAQGYAILKIPNTVKPGTYTLTATYAGQSIKNTVKVKQVLKLAKVKVKKSAKKLVIKATLKGKTAIKGKKLTFKFNGKKYTAKTNKKGIAKITIKKSVLKKLKVGKKVKYQVTYLKDTVKQSVKVKK